MCSQLCFIQRQRLDHCNWFRKSGRPLWLPAVGLVEQPLCDGPRSIQKSEFYRLCRGAGLAGEIHQVARGPVILFHLDEGRNLCCTAQVGVRTSGVEIATWRGSDGAWYFSTDDFPQAFG